MISTSHWIKKTKTEPFYSQLASLIVPDQWHSSLGRRGPMRNKKRCEKTCYEKWIRDMNIFGTFIIEKNISLSILQKFYYCSLSLQRKFLPAELSIKNILLARERERATLHQDMIHHLYLLTKSRLFLRTSGNFENSLTVLTVYSPEMLRKWNETFPKFEMMSWWWPGSSAMFSQ